MCAHRVDKNAELLEVGSWTVEQGRRKILPLQKVTGYMKEIEAVTGTFCLFERAVLKQKGRRSLCDT